MRMLPFIALVTIALAGCDQSRTTPARTSPPVVEPPAEVEIGGPRGGIHVDDPAGGTKVDIGGQRGGVHVDAPDSKVDVP